MYTSIEVARRLTTLTESDLKAALPDLTTTQQFSQLRSGAVIRRDEWGIPHIQSNCEYDLFFAQGFATAQDRLFQMDFDRLRGLGRSAEYLGQEAIHQDRYMRQRRLDRISRRDYECASSAARQILEAYAAGVNAFMDTAKALPVEYMLLNLRPGRWEPWHCIVVYKVRNTAEGSFQGKLWLAKLAAEVGVETAAKLSQGYQPGCLVTVPAGGRAGAAVLSAIDELHKVVEATSALSNTRSGSNAWVISGIDTQSGLPLLAGDSHRGLEVPNVYSQVHLIGPDFAVLGYSIPGMPMAMHFCHNEHVAWGMTAGSVDTQDLFVEKFRSLDGALEYLYEDRWLRADCAMTQLSARGSEVEQLELVESHHGPVIAGDARSGIAITLADPGSKEGTPWIDAAYGAMRARTADQFEAALEEWTDRVNNYVYADVYGEFGYVLRGRIPVRSAANGWGPVPGWLGGQEWQGYIAPSELPRLRNPPIGWVVSCNQRIVDESYPYYLTNFGGTGYRAERIVSRLAGLRKGIDCRDVKATVADMSAIHADNISIPAGVLQRALPRLQGLSEVALSAVADLRDWDCAINVDSAQTALYEVTAAKLAELTIRAHYGVLAERLLRSLDGGAEEHWRRHVKEGMLVALEKDDDSWLPAGTRWVSLLGQALELAVAELERTFGPDKSRWRWGDLHRVSIKHPLARAFPEAASLLNPPSVQVGGDGDTPLLNGFKVGAAFDVSFSSVNRYAHDPANWSRGQWIVPLGASGHPGSPHYSDQQQLWAAVESIPQLWDWDEIGLKARSEQELRPLGSQE